MSDNISWLVYFVSDMFEGLGEYLNYNTATFQAYPENAALLNAVICSALLTAFAIIVGGFVQAFFNLFGAVFRSAGVRGVRRRG